MSRHTDALLRGRDVIDRMARKIKVKAPDGHEVEVSLLDRARELADAWAADQPPKGEPGPGRGGSSSVEEGDDRREANAITRRAAAAASRLKRAPAIAAELDAMYRDVTYLTSITKERPDVPEETLAGCRSCARAGINEAVYHKSKVSGLCRWCAEKLDDYDELPVEAIHIRHSRGPKAATLWLQAHASRKDDTLPPSCPNRATVLGFDMRCYRGAGHDGDCHGVGIDGKRVTWRVEGAKAVMQ